MRKCYIFGAGIYILLLIQVGWYLSWRPKTSISQLLGYNAGTDTTFRSRNSGPLPVPASASNHGQNQDYPPIPSKIVYLGPEEEKWRFSGTRMQALHRPDPANETLTIIVPFRDREEQLDVFIDIMSSFIHYNNMVNTELLIVEQCDSGPFNRGKLFNAGIHTQLKRSDYFCFHDMDLVPANGLSGELYAFPPNPRDLAVNVHPHSFILPTHRPQFSPPIVLCMSKKDVIKVNGWSNNLAGGLGAENVDMLNRIAAAGLIIERPEFALYWFLPRSPAAAQSGRADSTVIQEGDKLGTATTTTKTTDSKMDGFSNVKYRIDQDKTEENKVFRRICVDLSETSE